VNVTATYFNGTQNGVVCGFIHDLAAAYDAAYSAKDEHAIDIIHHIWLEYFQERLLKMPASKLIQFLEDRQVWRECGEWSVFKTVDEPCIAYTAQKSSNGSVVLIALGICYRYPKGGEDTWWKNVIEPRVRGLS
jgi:hypothetical protein